MSTRPADKSFEPYLSVVACSRNDDHGGNLLHRMQLFVTGLIEQCRRHQFNAELILVEWNPPGDKPKLIEALSYPVENGRCDVRIIEVPPEIHGRFKHSDRLPLFQMIAKNVGIRRARAPFVLATNIDILFSDEIMKFLGSKTLSRRRMYRVDRYDVQPNVPADASIEQQLEFCRNHIIRINRRPLTTDITRDVRLLDSLAKRPWTWRDWRRWPLTNEARAMIYWPRDHLRARLMKFGVRLEALQDSIFPNSLPQFSRFQIPVNLHTNACGDFTLLSAEGWNAVRGYPELEIFSMHLDSLLCFAAHHSGAREAVLRDPMRIYHIEHGTGSGWTPEGEAKLYGRIDAAGISRLPLEELFEYGLEMRRNGRAKIFNDENWGLANEDLPETVIGSEGNRA
jgi:hypothetical protein